MSTTPSSTADHLSPPTSPDISPRTPSSHIHPAPSKLLSLISPSVAHHITYIRTGRRPPMTARGETLWAPSDHPYPEMASAQAEEYDDEGGWRALDVKQVKERRRWIANHIATTMMRLDKEDDNIEAATRAKYSFDTNHVCFHPAYPHIQAFVDQHFHYSPQPGTTYNKQFHREQSSETGSSPNLGESSRLIPLLCAPQSKRVHFPSQGALVQARLFEIEEEEEEKLEEYFANWSEEDKKALLRLDPDHPPIKVSEDTTEAHNLSQLLTVNPDISDEMYTISSADNESTFKPGESVFSSALQSETFAKQDCIIPASG